MITLRTLSALALCALSFTLGTHGMRQTPPRTEYVYIVQPVDLAARAQAKYKGGNINLADAIPNSALNKR